MHRDPPVFLGIADLAREVGCHPQQAYRARNYGYIRPAVYIGERDGYAHEAVDGVRRYLAAIERRKHELEAQGKQIPGQNLRRPSHAP